MLRSPASVSNSPGRKLCPGFLPKVTEATATNIGFPALNQEEKLAAGLEVFENAGGFADLGYAHIACRGAFPGSIVMESPFVGFAIGCFDDDGLAIAGGRKILSGTAAANMEILSFRVGCRGSMGDPGLHFYGGFKRVQTCLIEECTGRKTEDADCRKGKARQNSVVFHGERYVGMPAPVKNLRRSGAEKTAGEGFSRRWPNVRPV